MKTHAPAVRAILVIALLAMAAVAIAASFDEVQRLFAAADYPGARAVDLGLVVGGPRGEATLWQQRLTEKVPEASELAAQLAADTSLPLPLRIQAALDGATIAQAAGRSRTALQLLAPLLDADEAQELPGAVYLWAGIAASSVGLQQRAREYLATVRPEDDAFAAARYQLGRIGLLTGENELALRYFESAGKAQVAIARPELDAGRWEALRLLGREVEARELADRIRKEAPASLAALEVDGVLRRDAQDAQVAAAAADTAVAPSVTPEPQRSGLLSVQLAAYSDRALAMQFLARWRVEIPGLRVDEDRDDSGQILYKVRTGAFVSRPQADTERDRIQRTLGLQGFVVESGG